MSIKASCEPCGWAGKLESSLAGKKTKCPDCGNLIHVPRQLEEDPGYEVVEDDEQESRPSRRRRSDEDDRDRRRGRDEDDNRPSARRRRDDDDRDRGRRDRDDDDERDRRRSRRDEDDRDRRSSRSDDDARDRRSRDRDDDSRRRDRDDDDRTSGSRKPSSKAKIENRGKEAPKPLQGPAAIIVGILMMIGAVIWFVCGWIYQDWIYYYPPVLFILGIVTIVRGFTGSDD